MRKLLSILMLFTMLLCCATAQAGADRYDERYEAAIGYLGEKKYSAASATFSALGSYGDAPRYAMYCNAIIAGESGLYGTAVENLKSLNGFLDSSILATYYAGLSWEAGEDYERAQELLNGISLYRDVAARLAGYPALINARDYKKADADEKAGKLDAALSGFLALGQYEDSASRAASLQTRINERDAAAAEAARSAAYAAADQAEKDGRYEAAYDGFTALGDYSDSKERAEAVRQRAKYAKGMSLIASGAYKQAYTVFKELGKFEDSEKKVYALGLVDFAVMKKLDETTASYKFHDKMGIINFTENKVVIPQWDDVALVTANCLKTWDGELCGLIDANGVELTPCKWYGLSGEIDGVMVAALRLKDEAKSTRYSTTYKYDYYLVDIKGNELTPAYQSIGGNEPSSKSYVSLHVPVFSSGLIRVQDSNGNWGFVDQSGKVKISMNYAAASDFSGELAAVKTDKWGYINASGAFVIQPQFAEALDFNENDRAEVRSRTSWHVIDKSGAIVYFEGQSFDAAPAPGSGKKDSKQIMAAAAAALGGGLDEIDVMWCLLEMSYSAGAVHSEESSAALFAAIEQGDAEAFLAAFDDLDALLTMLGITVD